MMALADTTRLTEDGVLTAEQAAEIERRSRAALTALAINAVLCFGILAATGGLIFLLAAPLPVAVFGALALAAGLAILLRGGETYRIFGSAATLIGAGMLMGGAGIELVEKAEESAGLVLLLAGGLVAALSGYGMRRAPDGAWFALGAVLLMGLAAHLVGLTLLAMQAALEGWPRAFAVFYGAVTLAAAGWWIDLRLITALAIVPFAQMLDTGTAYFPGAYVFYSPEPVLTVLQMGALIGLALLVSRGWADRDLRHARVLAVLAFVVLNLAALVGSLRGDVVGETLWSPRVTAADLPFDERQVLFEAWKAGALEITAGGFAVAWAVLLAVVILWAAWSHQRGLFNTALSFGGLHAYTQLFTTFGDEPLAYVLGGLAAVPLAWGMWWLNRRMGTGPATEPNTS